MFDKDLLLTANPYFLIYFLIEVQFKARRLKSIGRIIASWLV